MGFNISQRYFEPEFNISRGSKYYIYYISKRHQYMISVPFVLNEIISTCMKVQLNLKYSHLRNMLSHVAIYTSWCLRNGWNILLSYRTFASQMCKILKCIIGYHVNSLLFRSSTPHFRKCQNLFEFIIKYI